MRNGARPSTVIGDPDGGLVLVKDDDSARGISFDDAEVRGSLPAPQHPGA